MTAAQALPPLLLVPADAETNRRLWIALFFALGLHALLILGLKIGEIVSPETASDTPTLEVTLAPTRASKEPEDADYLAQNNQEGAGNSSIKAQPTSPPPLVLPLPANSNPAPLVLPPPVSNPAPPVLVAVAPIEPSLPVPVSPATPEPVTQTETLAPVPEVVPDESSKAPVAPQPKPVKKPNKSKAQTAPDNAPSESKQDLPSAAQLVTSSMEIASLSARLSETATAYSKRPRQKFISTRTKEFRYASYMEAWRAKVERIGNLNYPEDAKRNNLSGSLILDVALNPDGSVSNISVRRSSGEKVLDDAAINIVRLAAPYGAFPPDIRREVDVLHITRTWEFENDNHFSTR